MSIGTELRAAREHAGLTLADVSRSTRVRATLIGQIENDDWNGCGGDVYARGHIRSIATAVGVDAAPLIERFDAVEGHGEIPELHAALETTTGSPRIRERRGPNWLAAAVGAAAVITLLLAVSLAFNGKGGSGTTGSGGKVSQTNAKGGPSPVPTASAPAPSSVAPVVAPPATPPVVAQLAPVVVSVSISAPSWVLASTTGKDLGPGMVLTPGTTKQFTSDHPIKITVGNAGGVDFTVNGKHIGMAGATGEVLNSTFGPVTATSGQG